MGTEAAVTQKQEDPAHYGICLDWEVWEAGDERLQQRGVERKEICFYTFKFLIPLPNQWPHTEYV